MVYWTFMHILTFFLDFFTIMSITDSSKDMEIIILHQQVRILQVEMKTPSRISDPEWIEFLHGTGYWIEPCETEADNCDIGICRTDEYQCRNLTADIGQDVHLSSQYLDKRRGVYTMRVRHHKSEIAQRELSDLGRGNHADRKPSII